MAPSVTAVAPDGGPTVGGTLVTLTGTGFIGATGVTFGGINAPLFVVDSDVQIRCTAPALLPGAVPGAVDVQVTGPNGTSPVVNVDLYTYIRTVNPADPVVPLLPVVVPQTTVMNLRLLIGERVPRGGRDTDTRFTDDELADAINRHNGNLYLAAGELWSGKAAEFAGLVDVAESGSEDKLSQLFKNANAMSASYTKAGQEFQLGLISPVVGRSARLLDPAVGSTFDALDGGLEAIVSPDFDPWMSGTVRWWPLVTVLT